MPRMSSKNLQGLIYRSALTSSLVPILIIELALVLLYFGINAYISEHNKQTLFTEVSHHLRDVTRREVNNINTQLQEVSRYAAILQRDHEKFFANSDSCFLPNDTPRFAVHRNGAYYKTNNNGGASLYYSASTSIGTVEKKKALCSEMLDDILISVVQTSPIITQAYINTWDNMVRIYPFLDNAPEQFGPALDLTAFNFYYLADARHNPQRLPVWTGVYLDPAGQGWMISNVVPIYRGDFLEGVSGVDVTLDVFVKQILDLQLPWNAQAFMVEENGSILAIPAELAELLGLPPLKTQGTSLADTAVLAQSGEYNLLSNKELPIDAALKELFLNRAELAELTIAGTPYLVSQEIVPATGWRLLTLVDKSAIFTPIYALDALSKRIGIGAIVAMLFFYAAFFLYLQHKSSRLAARIAEPIENLSKLTGGLGAAFESAPPGTVGIREIDRLSNNFSNMTQELGRRTKDLIALELREKIKEKEAEILETLALTDRLTGLANRHKLDEVLEDELARFRRFGMPFGVILLDLDHFKEVNDTHGHQVGDQFLKETAELLANKTRQTDTAGRWGGEEFLIVCPKTDRKGLLEMAENLRQALQAHHSSPVGHKTASFGLALSQPDDKVRDIISRADKALYLAKSRGRNRVEFGQPLPPAPDPQPPT